MNGFEEDPKIDIKIAEEGKVLRQLLNMCNQMLEKQNDQESSLLIFLYLSLNTFKFLFSRFFRFSYNDLIDLIMRSENDKN